jgi:hypothetical protein
VETIRFWWKVNSDWALAEQLHKLFSWLYFEYENRRRTDTQLLAFTGTPYINAIASCVVSWMCGCSTVCLELMNSIHHPSSSLCGFFAYVTSFARFASHVCESWEFCGKSLRKWVRLPVLESRVILLARRALDILFWCYHNVIMTDVQRSHPQL